MTIIQHTYYTAYVKLGQQEPFTKFSFPAASLVDAVLYANKYTDATLPTGAHVYKITWRTEQ